MSQRKQDWSETRHYKIRFISPCAIYFTSSFSRCSQVLSRRTRAQPPTGKKPVLLFLDFIMLIRGGDKEGRFD